ncbi:hypothetical protein B0T25DRAFT_528780 [Lasiosphaeria hispida]|uniref:Uncharacterized protein n=1 Tax=Lasiosphaeria hispida TaxID=260671 RepID=A0AAJ0MKL2_9PEZI|nr:hypothetical protein B0T25DRAFT_528780 [Lasiosphaeria hispida]
MTSTNPFSVVLTIPTTIWLVEGAHRADELVCAEPRTIDPAQINAPGVAFNAQPKVGTAAKSAVTVPSGNAIPVTYTCLYTLEATQTLGLCVCPGTTTIGATNTGRLVATPSVTGGNHTTKAPAQNGVSTGAAAGIGIGVAIAVIAIATAAAWLFFRRRQRPEDSPVLPIIGADKSQKRTVTGPPPPSNGGIGGLAGLHHYLLDGAGDSEIVSELTSLGHLLKDHVQTSYHKAPLDRNHLSQVNSSLSGLGLDRATQSHIANLALNERTRHIAIRGLLARVIFSALDVSSGSSLSLLPPSVAAFARAIPLDSNRKLTPQDITALSTWRRVSAYLLHQNRVDRSPLQVPTTIDTQIRDMQVALDGCLSIFVHDDARARANQVKGLERAIRACAKFGYAMFSHPCEWGYLFWNEAVSSAVVVLPGLERLSGPDGEVYKSGHVVVHPTIEEV